MAVLRSTTHKDEELKTLVKRLLLVYLMVKTGDMVLVNDHYENFNTVEGSHKYIFPPTKVGAKELEKKKRKRRDKHMRRNTINRFAFTELEKYLKKWISFHSTFTRKRYLKGIKIASNWSRWNYFDTLSPCTLLNYTVSLMCFHCCLPSLLFGENE